MGNKPQPMFCCLAIHGAQHKFQDSEAAFQNWKNEILTEPLAITQGIDTKGFPVFYVAALVYVQHQPGFLEKTFLEICARHGLKAEEIGGFHERYLSAQQLFISEIGSEEPEPAVG